VRLQRSIVVLVVIVACTHVATRLSSTQQHAVVVIGNPDFGTIQINTSSAARAFQIGPEGEAFQENTVVGITTCSNFPLVSIGDVATSGSGNGSGLNEPIYRRCAAFGGGGYGGDIYGDTVTCSLFDVRTLDFAVKFSPIVTGPQSCTITIHADTGNQTILVSGVGKLPDHAVRFEPRLAAMPFPKVRVNDESNPFQVKVVNAGGLGLSVTATKTGDAAFELKSGTLGSRTIPFGGSDTFQLTCKPTALGPVTGDLLITTNADEALDTSLPIALSCEGIPSDSINFTPNPPLPMVARVGETVEQVFTLENDAGNVAATITSVSLVGSHPGLVLTPATGSVAVGV
jgi:hypothetical protein